MAEALLRDRLAGRGVPAYVHSAGLLEPNRAASAYGVDVLRARGLDLSHHRSRTLTRDMVTAPDLVVGMARLHVRESVVLAPEVWPRAFTLKELVRRGEDVGPRSPDQSLEEWLLKVHAGRTHTDLLGESEADDIFDPMGSRRVIYERTADDISALCDRLVSLVAGEPSQA